MVDLPTSELDYPLDAACIADRPADPREDARLMVVHRATGEVVHARVRDLPRWLRAGDHMVVNRTVVMRARFRGRAEVRGGMQVEGLLLEARAGNTWFALVKHARRFQPGDVIHMLADGGRSHGDAIRLIAREGEGWAVAVEPGGGASASAAIERSGWTPLPPYIVRARANRAAQVRDDDDRAWYQTVFAHARGEQHPADDARPSVAAPTAGLHFTPALLGEVAARGVMRLEVSLQVGAGTFKTVDAPTLGGHTMHEEWCHVPAATMRALRAIEPLRAAGTARVLAVGTTSVRALESMPPDAGVHDDAGWSGTTRLLIQPGYAFRHVDALLTNFHLPRSTLLALVGAFVGLPRLKGLYAQAQRQGYRFFSYGDAMLIV